MQPGTFRTLPVLLTEWRGENWRRLTGKAIPFDAEEFRTLERRIIAHAGRHDTSTAHGRC